LSSVAEFRDLVVVPAALPPPPSQRTPGSGPQSGQMRRAEVEAAGEMGQTPSGGGASGRSGRMTPLPPPSRTGPSSGAMRPTQPGSRNPTPTNPNPTRRGVPDDDETAPFTPANTSSGRMERSRKEAKLPKKPPFDWTPVLLVVVLVLSAVIGYLVLMK